MSTGDNAAASRRDEAIATPGENGSTSDRAILVVGLGPGRWEDLTLAARDALERAPAVTVRTTRHPTVDALRERRPELAITTFDALYESAENFATLYPAMVDQLLADCTLLPPGGRLVYAVPGHPLIGEESVRLLSRAAPTRGIGVEVVPGLSFMEPVCVALGLDPLARDLQILDATILAGEHPSAMMGVVLPTHPAMVAQVYNRRLAAAVKLALSEVYPDDWPVTLVRWAGLPEQQIETLPLYALDRGEHADHLTTLFVPALDPLQATRVPEGLRYITARLRAPDGCPWDREQTHASLRRYVIEEAYEVAEVLDAWDGSQAQAEKLTEELGDLLLQVYLHAEIGDQEDLFTLGDVYAAVSEKLIRRHPHVFGDTDVRDAEHVKRNWEVIKRAERESRGEDVATESPLRGVPQSAPALYQAYELGRKAAKVGFAFPSTQDAVGKVAEEARELAEAAGQRDREDIEWELGDLLFALTRVADHLGIEPEHALHAANQRFRRRFEAMLTRAASEGRGPAALSADQWIALWQQAKRDTDPSDSASGPSQHAHATES